MGYLQCASSLSQHGHKLGTLPPNATDAARSFPPHVACPFAEVLRRMLPQPGVLSRHDLASLEALEKQGPIRRTMTCNKNGHQPWDEKGLASVICRHASKIKSVEEAKRAGFQLSFSAKHSDAQLRSIQTHCRAVDGN